MLRLGESSTSVIVKASTTMSTITIIIIIKVTITSITSILFPGVVSVWASTICVCRFFAKNLIGRVGKFYCSFLSFLNNEMNNGSLSSEVRLYRWSYILI